MCKCLKRDYDNQSLKNIQLIVLFFLNQRKKATHTFKQKTSSHIRQIYVVKLQMKSFN